MSHLDEYVEDASQHNLGNDVVREVQKQGQKQAERAVQKTAKAGMKRIRGGVKKIMKKTGLDKVQKAAKKGIKSGTKAAGKAAARGLGAAIRFLATNPVGWVISACLAAVLLVWADKRESAKDDAVAIESSSTLIAETQGSPGAVQETLTEDGVAVLMADCPEEKQASSGGGAITGSMEANARLLYSVFKGYGLTDECIAGMLGNLQVEGSVDPTTIEGIYNEPHQVGPRKQAAFSDLSSYTTGTVFPMYASSGVSINRGAYQASDGNYYCGIGMVQWTGPGAYQMLSVGQSTGHDWYSMEYQLAYMVSDAHYRPGFFAQWKTEMSSSAEEAAFYFAKNYEGNTTMAMGERKSNASAWLGQMSSWTVDTAYFDSVIGLSQNMGGTGADAALGEANDACDNDVGTYDNSSIASAAVSYAYATQAESMGNNGTALYQKVHDNVYPGDGVYMACDRSVACAVRWSGSDDDYPSGNTDNQYVYLKSSPKWESVGMSGSVSMDQLQPGDVFILNGHTFMYVGSEIIQQVHKDKADPASDSVSGSLGERSPGCGKDSASLIQSNGGQDWSGRGQYEIFRCVNPDNSERYKHAGSSTVLE